MKKRAFTLVELLVVISIIALLLSILMPALGKVRIQARRIICGTRVKSMHMAALLYANDDEKGRLPSGGYHYQGADLDDAIGMEITSYFGMANYIAHIPGLPTGESVMTMPIAELADYAKQCAKSGPGQVFVCPELKKDRRTYYDVFFRENRTMETVVFSYWNYARIGYCYLAGFETEKWNYDTSDDDVKAWRSPMTMADKGSLALVTDRVRYVPAGEPWGNQDFIELQHSDRGYELILPVGTGFDYKKLDAGTNICTLDGAVKYEKIRRLKKRQIHNDTISGGVSHKDYTFF